MHVHMCLLVLEFACLLIQKMFNLSKNKCLVLLQEVITCADDESKHTVLVFSIMHTKEVTATLVFVKFLSAKNLSHNLTSACFLYSVQTSLIFWQHAYK